MKKLLLIALLTMAFSVNAATVSFFLDNVMIDTDRNEPIQQMTGTFDWTYTGDFADGGGTFTELFIPHHGSDFSSLDITIEPKSLEFSFNDEVHNVDVNVTLRLDPVFTLAGGPLDLTGSTYTVNTITGTFVSGRITPTVVPVPAAFWLFGAGLVGLVGVARRKS